MTLTKYLSTAILASSLITTSVIAGKYNAILDIGDSMPTFSDLPDISGGTLSSDDLTESVVVFVSLANHCPWVRGMDQDLVKLTNQFEAKDVRVIGISMNHREDDRLPAMKQHAKKAAYNFNYVFDESQQFGRQLGATRTPEYFVFNKDRKLVYMGLLHNSPGKINSDGNVNYINGTPSEFYVENAIETTLSGEAIANAETRAHGCTIKYVQ